MKHGYLVIFISLGLVACATNGPESSNPDDPAEVAQNPDSVVAAEAVAVKHNVPSAAKESGLIDEDTLICRREKVVGSHIPKKVCLSARDRENLQRTSQSAVGRGKRTAQPTSPEG